MIDFSFYPNFTRAEMTCHCGCGRADISPLFMERLQVVRDFCNFPLVITSGFRCPDYNERVATTGRDGPHTTGHAADILIYGYRAYDLVRRATLYGMTGIGLKQKGDHATRYVHLDDLEEITGKRPRPWVWTY